MQGIPTNEIIYQATVEGQLEDATLTTPGDLTFDYEEATQEIENWLQDIEEDASVVVLG